MKILIIFAIFLLKTASAVVTHDNEQVWRVFSSGENKPEIKNLVDQLNLDIWAARTDSLDVLITPEISSLVETKLKELHLSHTVVIENIQRIIDDQEAIRNKRERHARPSAVIDLEIYHTFDEINAYIDELAAEFEYVTVETIGQSIEGRDMRVVRLATQPNNPNAIWVQCGIHAREWVAPASCLYGLDYFTSNYGQDPDATSFLDSQDVYMVVVGNPDGYVYSWTDDRNWRKSRRQNEGSDCVGVDLNRNYDDGVTWGGSSTNPCSNSYQGLAGFSEPETAAIRDKVYSVQELQNIKAFYDFHSYGNLWLFAYGYTADPPSDYDTMNEAAAAASAAVLPLYGTAIEYGSSYVVLYEAIGTSKDWAYAYDIIYSYTMELRDNGEFGFFLPEDQIIPTAIEAWTGVFAAAEVMV